MRKPQSTINSRDIFVKSETFAKQKLKSTRPGVGRYESRTEKEGLKVGG